MLLHADPGLAEAPDFSPEQLEALARGVERKKQKLEEDIQDYIRKKQDELRRYEKELVEKYRKMEGLEPSRDANEPASNTAPNDAIPDSSTTSTSQLAAESATVSNKHGSDETGKRTKHTRVHKREKELCGLVTPIFLPLLDASGDSPGMEGQEVEEKKKKKKEKRRHREDREGDASATSPTKSDHLSPSRGSGKEKENRRTRSRSREGRIEGGENVPPLAATSKQKPKHEAPKNSKPSSMKKPSIRSSRRKRVSLVIDDQIVHPSDNIAEAPPVTSPSETTVSSASASTSSLDSTLDPQLRSVTESDPHIHQEPVHHSLPLSMSLPPSASPTKPTATHTLIPSPSATAKPIPTPHLLYSPPSVTGPTFLSRSRSPPHAIPDHDLDMELDTPLSAPKPPIYADSNELLEEAESDFTSFVGGIDGSGVDDLDQAGSYGYPSSLGASYLESYMQRRPLSVRMKAVEKAELEGGEKERVIAGSGEKGTGKGVEGGEEGVEVDLAVGLVDELKGGGEVEGEEEDEFMGEMEAV
ncbi:hypothetical protein BCR34DRAFT_180711 [Clohesyomyces aquaticus]|uniref:Uncharacterized protein n=1 Tax=Clohesyomyces aquaticus TaxID=1231657 RepID=A0A1Y1YEJ9_9PLEO|nr:hypothetical protein BCR34DRAFT_180711 [Clohesyomyces aquaticus]